MPIPKDGWRDMSSAPRDGTIIAVKYSAFNGGSGPPKVQFVHWLCDENADKWGWKRPWMAGYVNYADEWMTVEELRKRAETAAPEPKKAAPVKPAQEFDL